MSRVEHEEQTATADSAEQQAERIVRQALPQFGIDPDTSLALITQRENTVFSCDARGTALIVRLHRAGYHDDQALAEEVKFVHALRDQGVSVPDFYRTLNGAPFATVEFGANKQHYQIDVQAAIANSGDLGDPPASDPEAVQPAASDFFEVGRMLAEVHNATERSGFQIGTDRSAWDENGLFGAQATWGDPLSLSDLQPFQADQIAAAIQMIRAALRRYGQAADRFGPIHADPSPANLLRSQGRFALIDFDDFGAGWHLFDLATALYAFTPHSRYIEYRTQLLLGYESVRSLRAEDHAVFDSLLVARGLSYLGWAANRRGEPAAEAQVIHKLPRLMKLVEHYNTRKEGQL